MEISHVSHGISPLHSAGHLANTRNNSDHNDSSIKNESDLDDKEQQQVQKMKARDREVRTHEQAHKSAGGSLAGVITYQYQTGPDGKQYVVEGEVQIDTSPVKGDPEATARKADQIQKAATAPAEPSAQDMQVAAQAFAMKQQAQTEQREKKAAEDEEKREERLEDQKKVSDRKDNSLNTSPNISDKKTDNVSVNGNKTSETEGATCAICGGSHSGETHTEANVERLNKVFEIARAETTSISIINQLA